MWKKSRSIRNQYSIRSLILSCGVLAIFTLVYAAVEMSKEESRYQWHFQELEATLRPPVEAALTSEEVDQLKALLSGFLVGQGLLGLRVITDDRIEAVYRSGWQPHETQVADYKFKGLNPTTYRIEIFSDRDLFEQHTAYSIGIFFMISIGCILLIFTLQAMATHHFLLKPLQILHGKIASLKVCDIYERELLLEPQAHPGDEYADLEQAFLRLIRQLQIEHREAVVARHQLANWNKTLTHELEQHKQQLEQQVAKSFHESKLQALGEMAGGIAHEINNPLAILVGRMAQLQKILLPHTGTIPQTLAILDSMERSVFRIQEAVIDLETLASNPSSEESKVVRVPRVLTRLRDIAINRFSPRGVTIELILECEAEVWAREVELSQGLLYLVENAAEAAMQHPTPKVRISLSNLTEEAFLIRVSDNGPGIPEDLRQKVFQPFFSTKEVGKGRGVGLSLAKTMIESHEGHLAFDFQAKDTTIGIRLRRYKTKDHVA